MKLQLLALLPTVYGAMHINYYSDTNCKNWIGQKDIGSGWGEQTFASPQGTHSALSVELNYKYQVRFYANGNPGTQYLRGDGQCWGTTGQLITHLVPW
ncbi:hypothetical protein BU24DRAFT_493032 [Aaosphaeria arxii CBS 175.79]|uniref:Fucose-specific lectin n=1 Tax=Aaosphaeria arxii CBS 175.79 TaxID=1450172 RepID=A0A6A5XNA5_9PLEO|nr:uncharacterized protein BU24DRAFT_493032 [Aaosphaeria arxii CBS 175.79]KAF2014403.1 hypothetical protein BU24DRAFT_493032 [Aaosphaeria arxii CBS 175.79]